MADTFRDDSTLRPDSLAVHAGRDDLTDLGVHALPIDLSTTNPLDSLESGGACYDAMAGGGAPPEGGSAVYARLWNPTVARFEKGLAAMEHAEASVAYGSGMAAMTAAILATTRASNKGHIVAVRPLYGGSDHLLDSGLLGVDVDFVTAEQVGDAVTPDTGMVIAETPANPTLDLVDIADLSHQIGGRAPLLVDNTFATPVLQNPIDHGAQLVLHSATKYLGGHGDVVGGVIACDAELAAALRRVRAVTGGLLHPLGAYLLHRGLTTLPTRMRAQQRTARILAAWLRGRPEVDRVHYPEFTDHEAGSGLLGTQLRGPGAMIAIEMHGGVPAVETFVSSLNLFLHAVSLGGVDSLVQAPAALTHRPVAEHARPAARVVRLSIGLEDADDLVEDLDQALTAVTAQRPSESGHRSPVLSSV